MIIIIGGSGFIGTRLCRRLVNSGKDFYIIDKVVSKTFPNKTKVADVRNYEALLHETVGDVIINLAAEHRDDVTPKSLYYEVNVDGAKNVCRVAEEKGINTIIFTSSVAVYGFAPPGTDETGAINYFNEYGRTKYLAEEVYQEWQSKEPDKRTLVIVRPTVVFGEQNRGNVYNLLRQISSHMFIMVGDGNNIKSMAYVENVAAFLEFCLTFTRGVHLYNYIDKPDFDMNTLVATVYHALGKKKLINIKLPYIAGCAVGKAFDMMAIITGKKFPISYIRVKKFCSNSCFETNIVKTGFIPPLSIREGLLQTIHYEFIERQSGNVFYSE